MDEQYISFDEALQELGISESELRAMITRGQIRVFGRPGDEKFRQSAIDNLKRAGETQPTIILPSGNDEPDAEPSPFAMDETAEQPFAFDDDETQQEISPFADEDEVTDAMMPTIELSADETEEPVMDEEHTDVATQEVSLADEDYLILEDDQQAAPTGGRSRRSGYSSHRSEDEYEEEPDEIAVVEDNTPQPAMTAMLGILSIALLASAAVFIGAVQGRISEGLVETLRNLGQSLGII